VKPSPRKMGRPSLGGMLATRQGALILAALCAVCAAGILVFALSSYKRSVATTAVAPPQATVLVATGPIQKGTSGDLVASESLYKSTPIVASQEAPGAISDASALAGTSAQTSILPGQQLTTTDFAAVTGAAGLLAPNQRAVSIPTDETHGDLDVVSPGDHVDIYAELSQSGGSNSATVISLMIPNALVLKTPGTAVVGSAPAPTTAGTTTSSGTSSTGSASTPAPGGSALVLAVKSSIAPSLALTADSGKIWVVLRPANATAPAPGITTVGDVLSMTPAAVNAAGSASAPTSGKASSSGAASGSGAASTSTGTSTSNTTTTVTH
jgi:Flp pilus assembly protein CpaB